METVAEMRRQSELVRLFVESQGFCVFGHRPCAGSWQTKGGPKCGLNCVGCPTPNSGVTCHVAAKVVQFPQVWRCAFGHSCEAPFNSHYEPYADSLVKEWRKADNEQKRAEAKAERRIETGESGKLRGEWNETGRDVFYACQPQSYIEALGISGLTFTPFAKVRLASQFTTLHVDLGDALKPLSKNKRRKVVKYGRTIPEDVHNRVDRIVSKAIRRYQGY